MLKGETTMVSDQEIAKGVDNILRHSDPNGVNYSVNGVVQQLGAKLGLDLSHKAGFIRDQINRHLRQYPPQPPPSLLYQTQQHGAIKEHFAVQHNHYHQQAPSPHQFHHSLFQQQPQPLPHQQQPFPPHFALHFPGSFRGQVISSPTSSVPQLHQHQHQHQPTTQFQFQAQPNVRAHIQPGKHVAPGVAAEKSPKESGSAGTKKRGGSGGLNKVCGVSPELQAVVGESALPRTEIVKQLWAYIRKNNLQDPSNKRKIICDDALRAVFEIDCTDMFKMNKLLSKHIIPLGSPKESAPVKRMKVEVEPAVEITEPTQNVDPKETTQNVTPQETTQNVTPQETSKESPVIISDTLAAFLGTTSREMLQSDATKQVLEYIRINHLEDLNSMKVVCDAKLRELFGAESVPSAGIADMLARHHLFTSS